MSFKRKVITTAASVIVLAAVAANTASANEGTYNLRNVEGTDARCTVYSVLMQNSRYTMLVTCRDILYPGGQQVFQYSMWGQPADGSKPIKLGDIGLGKQEFASRVPLSSLFVTQEAGNVKAPTGPRIMQGVYEANNFLDGSTRVREDIENELEEATPAPTPTAEAATTQSSSRNIFRIIAAGGILAFLALFGVVLVIFVITRR